jgi:acyl-CoA thioesterase
MGDLAADAQLTPTGDGTFTATMSRDWEIWGPNGGYMAAFALDAARGVSGRARPANAAVHFLGAASFDAPIEVTATVQRATRQATSVHVRIDQQGKAVLAAMVWAVDAGIEGLDHDDAPMPDVADWRDLPTMAERIAADPDAMPSRYGFWDNFEQRPTTWLGASAWEARDLGPALYENWMRFASPAASDEWAQAARLLLLVDLGAWPSIGRRHRTDVWMAPSIDVSCEFHHLDPTDDWCLLQGTSPAARDGLIGSHQRVWNERGDLVASGISHLLCRRIA